jgi:hypothetical protein
MEMPLPDFLMLRPGNLLVLRQRAEGLSGAWI